MTSLIENAAREADGENPVPKLIGRGWEAFAEVAPADVADAVIAILERPELLAAQLSRSEGSLIHGDLKFGNLGFDGWDKALAVTERDPEAMAKEMEDLDWWVARARAALEKWSPV